MIHSSAIIEKGAELGKDVKIGPHCYVGPEVQLGDQCELRNAVTVVGRTTVGSGCVFFANCVVGEIPQDLKFKGEKTKTIIGQDNHFREFVTVHAGTELGGSVTRIGNHNRFLVGVHLAHDTIVGNHVIIANNVQVAGHVHVEDCVTMGGHAGIHHFVTVGKYAMLGGLSRVITDVPPYVTVLGLPAEVRGLNIEGLKRWGLPDSDISALNDAFRKLFAKRADESTPFTERLEQLVHFNGQNEHVRYFYEFIKRKLSVGNSGRYLESLRKDKREDRGDFFGAALSGE